MVVEAKDLLADSLVSMNLANWTRPRRRNNSKEHPSAKLRGDIEDIVSMYTFIDENLLTARLPIYVAADPDLMPSAKLTEGDLQCLLLKLNSLTEKVDTLGETVFTSDKAITGLAAAFAAGPMISTTRQQSNNNVPVQSSVNTIDNHVNQNPIFDDWDSDPSVQTVNRRKPNNRVGNTQQNGTSAMTYSTALVTGRADADGARQGGPRQQPTNRPTQARVTMLGSSTNTAFKAAKTLQIRKAVFKISNVDAGYSTANLIDHLTKMGVRLADDARTQGKSCFELKRGPRQPEDNKSFRICIFAADKSKLLVKDNWASGILIQEWIFRPNDNIPLGAHNEENILPSVPRCESPKKAMDTGVPIAEEAQP